MATPKRGTTSTDTAAEPEEAPAAEAVSAADAATSPMGEVAYTRPRPAGFETITKQPMVEESARLGQRRATQWVNIADLFGPLADKYVTPDGEPWRILLVTDMNWAEWEFFQTRPTYRETIEYANWFVLMHNGWTLEDGTPMPQPGDRMQVVSETERYEAATTVGPDGAVAPILDAKTGQPLYRLVTERSTVVLPVAFWRLIPNSLTGFLVQEAWRRSGQLPNLTNQSLSITSAQPTTNGASAS